MQWTAQYTSILLLISAISFVEFFGDSAFKTYSRTESKKSLMTGIIFYSLVIILLIKALTQSNLIYTNALWDATSTVIATLLAYFWLGERLNSPYQYVGLASIVMGIIFMGMGNIPKD